MNEHCFVILAHKESEYLEPCVISIMTQNLKTKALITTSTPCDFSKSIAKKYGIEYIVNDAEKKGVVNDFNFAYSIADSKLVTLAHQDDLYEPDFARCIIESSKLDSNAILYFTDCYDLINNIKSGSSIKSSIKKLLLFPFLFKKSISSRIFKKMMLVFGNPICCPAVTINKSLLTNFKFSNRFEIIYDWNAWIDLANEKGSFVYLNKKLIQYRFHEISVTSSQLNKFYLEELKMLQTIWGNKLGKFIWKLYSSAHNDRK
jgi:hypothetical protein